MESTIFKKAKLAAVIALASSTLTLTGCLVEGDESDSVSTSTTAPAPGNNHERVTAPKGTIQGVVQDTNGNFIEGAIVAIGGKETTTSRNGTYEFQDIAVSSLKVTGQNADYSGHAMVVTIKAPEGYLGATVTVTPAAVIDDGRSATAETETGSLSTNTFVDGFTATAGTAVLPKLSATVTGSVQEYSNGSSAALVGKSIALDMLKVRNAYQQQNHNGISTSYQTLDYISVIREDGTFEITGVPADSELRFIFDNFEIVDGAEGASTEDEALPVNVATISVEEIIAQDTKAPFVVSVDNVIALSSSVAMLKDDVNNEIVVRFSEALDAASVDAGELSADNNSVRVYDVTAGAYIKDGSYSVSGDALTISFNTPLQAGNELQINLLTADFMDQASNANSLVDGDEVGFDSGFTSGNGNSYVRLAMKVFAEDAELNGGVVATQLTDDNLGDDDLVLIQESNSVFQDVDNMTSGIQQLNSAQDSDNFGNSDVAVRLSELASKLSESIGGGEVEVAVNVARVGMLPVAASRYFWEVRDAAGEVVPGISLKLAQGADADGLLQNNNVVEGGYFTEDGSSLNIEMTMSPVKPGYELLITAYDDLMNPGVASKLTLKDLVGPTTILQDSYNLASYPEDIAFDDGVVGIEYGDGGEQSDQVNAAKVGTPYLNLTPRLLTKVDGTDNGPSNDLTDVNSFNALYALNQVNGAGVVVGGTAAGDHYIDPENNIYDKSAIEAYLSQNEENFMRSIGVSFSENITLVEDVTPAFESKNAGAAITPVNYVVQNDVMKNDVDGSNDPYADIVRFDVPNIYKFARLESGSTIDFTGAIKDQAIQPNAAAENAKVLVRDLIPALVTEANYYGDKLVVQFDKAIKIDKKVEIYLGNNTIELDPSIEGEFTISDDGKKLTIFAAAWETYAIVDENPADDIEENYLHLTETINIKTTFNLGQYDSIDTVDYNDSTRYTHASLDFSNIKSEVGVNWAGYNVAGEDFFFEAPKFAVVNELRDFDVDITARAISNDKVKIIVESSHELYFLGRDLSNGGEIEEFIDYTSQDINSIDAVAPVESSVSDTGFYTYSTTITLDNNIVEGDEVDFPIGWLSRFYPAELVKTDAVEVELN